MRDIQLPGRSVVHAVNGAAATSHPLSTLAAINILQQGGTAADAAVAACAVQCVVEPMSTGIGGDCFALHSAKGTDAIEALNGSGRAPGGLSCDYLLGRGISQIDTQSPHAVTIPGAVDAWAQLLERHGKLGLETVLQPAIRLASEGFAVTPRVALDWSRAQTKLRTDPVAAATYLKDGMAPVAGDIMRFPNLGKTLAEIAKHGRDAFYRGWVAEDIVGHLRHHGGTHELADFAQHSGSFVTPISADYRGRTVWQTPPNGQGLTTLLILRILSGYDLAALAPLSPERIHLETEAGRLAYEVRDRYLADPDHMTISVEELLSDTHINGLRARIDTKRALTMAVAPGPVYRDTICLSVVDRDRNVCSLINSLYFSFGSGLVSPKSGVVLQNRGAGFRVDPTHPNAVAPNKRPLHTIIPGLVTENGRPTLSFAVMGGSYQPVGQSHVLTNIVDFGMDVQEAIDCARTFHVGGNLELERGISGEIEAGLRSLGYTIHRPDMPWGGAQAIAIDWQRGTLAAGSDPRKDGSALGY
jgi:gamma-glutamyltranspeptidase/glutathione hydrolase